MKEVENDQRIVLIQDDPALRAMAKPEKVEQKAVKPTVKNSLTFVDSVIEEFLLGDKTGQSLEALTPLLKVRCFLRTGLLLEDSGKELQNYLVG